MAMTQKERTQLLGLLIAIGVGAPVGFWLYWRNPKAEEAQVIQFQIDSLQARIDTARADLAGGTLEALRATVSQYETALGVMRELVPANHEVVSLIDSVTTRAQMRGVEVLTIQQLSSEIEPPFQVVRHQLTVLVSGGGGRHGPSGSIGGTRAHLSPNDVQHQDFCEGHTRCTRRG